VIIGVVLFWAVVEVRLFNIQVRDHDFYFKQSNIQSAKKIKVAAQRGNIYDRNQECMATDLIHYDLGIDLNKVNNKDNVAATFARHLNRSKKHYLDRLRTSRQFIYLARKTPKETMQKITSVKDPGVVYLEGYRRLYPYGKCGSQIIGFTDVDNKGISGLELQYEDILRGKNGWTFLMADARRRFGYNVDYPHLPSQSGVDITLTINKNFQTIVEDELDYGVKKYNAKSGMVVLMNPFTGEILAMYSSPGFNPNNPATSSTAHRRNRVVTDIIEPGSTFKIFPAAILLQENIKKPDDIVFCENGKYRYYNHTVNDSKKYAWLSFQKVIENSSNIGMVKLSADIKKNTFYQYIKNFGFDSRTGINLQGESPGSLSKPKDFSGLSKGIISFGQEIGVTALQITNGYAAVVNGGKVMRPYLIKEIKDVEGNVLESIQPQKIRQVISPDVAETLTNFMLGAVKRGTGKKSQIAGVSVGGKTGTAQIFDKKSKRYIQGKYLSSFIGFSPAERAEYVLAVFLDRPRPLYYGGDVAAPIFASIMERILNFAPADTDDNPSELKSQFAKLNVDVPNFSGLPAGAVEDYCEFKNLDYSIEGEGNYIIRQGGNSNPVAFRLGSLSRESKSMPNLNGLTIREALKKIDFSLFRVKISGNGRVRKQSVKSGSIVKNRTELILTCGK